MYYRSFLAYHITEDFVMGYTNCCRICNSLTLLSYPSLHKTPIFGLSVICVVLNGFLNQFSAWVYFIFTLSRGAFLILLLVLLYNLKI